MATAASPGPPPAPPFPPERRRTPDHPPYAEMIQAAIRTLAEKGGSTAAAINRYIREEYRDLPWGHQNLFPHYLRKLVIAGEITQNKVGRYLLPHSGGGGGGAFSFLTRKPKTTKFRRRDRLGTPPSVLSEAAAEGDGLFLQPEAPTPVAPELPNLERALVLMHIDDSHRGSLNVDASPGELDRRPVVPHVPVADAVSHEDDRDKTHCTPEPVDSDDSYEARIITVAPITEQPREHAKLEDYTNSLPLYSDAGLSAEFPKRKKIMTDLDGDGSSKRKMKKAPSRKPSSVPVTMYIEKEVIIALPSPKTNIFLQKCPSYETVASYTPPLKPCGANVPPEEPVTRKMPSPLTELLSSSYQCEATVNLAEKDAVPKENPVSCVPSVFGDQIAESERPPSSLPVMSLVIPSPHDTGPDETTLFMQQESLQNVEHGSVSLSENVNDGNTHEDCLGKAMLSEKQESLQTMEHGSVLLSENANYGNTKEDCLESSKHPVSCISSVLGAQILDSEPHTSSSSPVMAEVMPYPCNTELGETTLLMHQEGSHNIEHGSIPLSKDVNAGNMNEECLENSKRSNAVVGSLPPTFPSDGTIMLLNGRKIDQDDTHVMTSGKCEISSLETALLHKHSAWNSELEDPPMSRPHTDSVAEHSILDMWKRRNRKKQMDPSLESSTHVRSDLQGTMQSQSTVPVKGRGTATTSVSDTVMKSPADPNAIAMSPVQILQMAFHQCNTDVSMIGRDSGSCQRHFEASTSGIIAALHSQEMTHEYLSSTVVSLAVTEPPHATKTHGNASLHKFGRRFAKKQGHLTRVHESVGDDATTKQPSSTGAAVTIAEPFLSSSNHSDASCPARRRLAKKQSKPACLPKNITGGSGFEQHGGLESQPLPVMEDKSSRALPPETIVSADKETVEPGSPISSKVDLLVIEQLPLRIKSSDTALPKCRGRPPKKKRKHTPVAVSVGISRQEVVSNSQSPVPMVEEGNLFDDATRFATVSSSSGLPLEGCNKPPGNSSPGKAKTAEMDNDISGHDIGSNSQSPVLMVEEGILFEDTTIPIADSSTDGSLPRRRQGRPPNNSSPGVPKTPKTLDINIPGQEAVIYTQPVVPMVEEGNMSEDTTRPTAASTSSGLLPLKRHGRYPKSSSPRAPKIPKTFVKLQSLLNLRSRVHDQLLAIPAEHVIHSSHGDPKKSLLEVDPNKADEISSLSSNSKSLVPVEEIMAPATGLVLIPKHHGRPPKRYSGLSPSSLTTSKALSAEVSLRNLRSRAHAMSPAFSSEVGIPFHSADVDLSLQSHQGKSPSHSSEIPATTETGNDRLLLPTRRTRSSYSKQKLEVSYGANSGVSSLQSHQGKSSSHSSEIPATIESENDGLSFPMRRTRGSYSKQKLEVFYGANSGVSSQKRNGRPLRKNHKSPAFSSDNNTYLDSADVNLSLQNHQGKSSPILSEILATPEPGNDGLLLLSSRKCGRAPKQKLQLLEWTDAALSSHKQWGKRSKENGESPALLSENSTRFGSTDVNLLLQSHQGKSSSNSSKIPATPEAENVGLLLPRSRGRSLKQKLEVLLRSNAGFSSHKYGGRPPKEKSEVENAANSEPSSTKHCGRPPKDKSEVADAANSEPSSTKRRGRPQKEKPEVPDAADNEPSSTKHQHKPPKDKSEVVNAANGDPSSTKHRGRPPKEKSEVPDAAKIEPSSTKHQYKPPKEKPELEDAADSELQSTKCHGRTSKEKQEVPDEPSSTKRQHLPPEGKPVVADAADSELESTIRRGRPPKEKPEVPDAANSESSSTKNRHGPPKEKPEGADAAKSEPRSTKRGSRPPKEKLVVSVVSNHEPSLRKHYGRPCKENSHVADRANGLSLIKCRGRPPKNGTEMQVQTNKELSKLKHHGRHPSKLAELSKLKRHGRLPSKLVDLSKLKRHGRHAKLQGVNPGDLSATSENRGAQRDRNT